MGTRVIFCDDICRIPMSRPSSILRECPVIFGVDQSLPPIFHKKRCSGIVLRCCGIVFFVMSPFSAVVASFYVVEESFYHVVASFYTVAASFSGVVALLFGVLTSFLCSSVIIS